MFFPTPATCQKMITTTLHTTISATVAAADSHSPALASSPISHRSDILIITENYLDNAGGEDDTERTETTDKEAEGEG